MQISRRSALIALPLLLAACGGRRPAADAPRGLQPGETPEMHALIRKYAAIHDIPESLLHRMVQRESGYNPAARHGDYYGLLQIRPQTARTMGYKGAPEGLLDAETNLRYAGKYLRGAWIVARGNAEKAEMWFAKGYYYEAKRLGLLKETGLKS